MPFTRPPFFPQSLATLLLSTTRRDRKQPSNSNPRSQSTSISSVNLTKARPTIRSGSRTAGEKPKQAYSKPSCPPPAAHLIPILAPSSGIYWLRAALQDHPQYLPNPKRYPDTPPNHLPLLQRSQSCHWIYSPTAAASHPIPSHPTPALPLQRYLPPPRPPIVG